MGLPQLRATHPHEDLGIYALDEAGGYMGHVNIYSTYWYLEATADLMRDVASAGEGFFAEGRQS
jgi:hypothetical protein